MPGTSPFQLPTKELPDDWAKPAELSDASIPATNTRLDWIWILTIIPSSA